MPRALQLLAAFPLLASPLPALAAGVIVAAGGGSEGDQGDTTAWSYKAYGRLIDNGDVNGDGQVRVAILSTATETSWLPNYLEWLGADDAFNLRVATRADANNTTLVEPVRTADVIFIKGGDQGEYYDLWNDSQLEDNIRYVVDLLDGAIGGTSAGAMSQAEFCLAGSQDLISLDVLQDAETPYLDDTDGGSSIHTDFLSFVHGVVIDTHYTTRARLGRLLGVLGKAVEDHTDESIMGIGIDERTAVIFDGATAEVVGVGSVDFIQHTPQSVLRRDKGQPLYYTNVRVDRLTEGWQFNLATRMPDESRRPASAKAVTYQGDSAPNAGSLTIRGSRPSDEGRFARTVAYAPFPYSTAEGTYTTYIQRSLGIVNAQDSDLRGAIHESLFRALYDWPHFSGFLVAEQGQLYRSSSRPDELEFQRNKLVFEREAASIVIDGKAVTWKDLSPYPSNLDTGSGTLKAAGFVNLRVHVLGDTRSRGARYNTVNHTVVGGPVD